MKPTRPALRYFGSKWRLAPWIIGFFPQHDCYVEPFCGSATVFFRKVPAEFEVINDIDGEIINFFRVLRERTDEFIAAIQHTPYSREEYILAWRPLERNPLERARCFYVRCWQGWSGGKTSEPSGWRYQHSNNRGKSVIKDWNATEHLHAIVWRLKQAFIENDDAMAVIERYDQPHTLYYVDPPYLTETRSKRWKAAYQHEIDEGYHLRLLRALLKVQGMVIISGYPSPLYDEMLAGWQREETKARTTNTPKVVTEVAWISPEAVRNRQQRLF